MSAERGAGAAPESRCPCGSGSPYAACCGPIHDGTARASTAERLMRSRYSAFAVGDTGYLLRSWHASTRPETLGLDADLTWKRLLVEHCEDGGPFDDSGFVTFTAIARSAAGREVQRERSRFVREGGLWVYLDGEPLDPEM